MVTADSDRQLLERLGDLADRVVAATRGRTVDEIVSVRVSGAPELEAEVAARLSLREGARFDPVLMESDRKLLESDPRIANVSARTQQTRAGIATHL